MDPTTLPSNPDENDGPRILGATLSTTSAALLIVAARLYVRLGVIRNFGWDDAMTTFAMALSTTGQVIIILQVLHGAGEHIGDVDPAVYATGMKLNFISQPIYLWVICIVKLSIGFSLLRIAATKFWNIFIKSVMGFMATYTLGCFFTIVFQCRDIRALWDRSVTFQCWSKEVLQALSYTNVSLNMLTDILFALVIPIPMLWKLKVPTRTRVVLVGVLALGLFACIAAAIKIQHLVNYGKLDDPLWDSRNITIWTVTESNVGIIAGSIPTLRPLFKNVFGGIYGTGSNKTGATPVYYGHGSRAGYARDNTWKAISSNRTTGKSNDRGDASSETAINDDLSEEFELETTQGQRGGVSTVISSDGIGRVASLSKSKRAEPDPFPRGITKVTQTTIAVSDPEHSRYQD